MPLCPICARSYPAGHRFCPDDGAALRATSPVAPGAADAWAGAVLDGKYRIEERIGAGGMGTVYRARHLAMDRRVAVKLLRPEVAAEPDAARRFRREAKHCSRLSHPGCVRVTDFGAAQDGTLYLVMDYLDGTTVGEELHAGGPIAPRRVAHIAAQAARALHHAHGFGLIHRDLKPDNLMLVHRDGDRDAVVVLDFGLAKLLAREGDLAITNASLTSLTRAGIVFGTPEYMAPEQATGGDIDERTDVYALGVVLYEMVVGRRPFAGATFMEILTHHVRTRPRQPAAVRPDLAIPAALDRAIMRCLEKDPARRYPTAAALADDLEAIRDELAARVPRALAAAATVDLSTRAAAAAEFAGEDRPAATLPLGAGAPAPAGTAPRGRDPGARDAATLPLGAGDPAPTGTASTAAGAPAVRRPRRRWAAAIAATALAATALALAVRRHGDHRPNAAHDAVAASRGPAAPDAAPAAGVDAAAPRGVPDAAPEPRAAQPPRRAPPDARPRATRRRPRPDRGAVDRLLADAEAARRSGHWLRVLALGERALSADPSSRRAAFLIGEALVESGDERKACAYLRKAGTRWGAPALRRRAGCGD